MSRAKKAAVRQERYYDKVSIGLVTEGRMRIIATLINKDDEIIPSQFKHLCRGLYHVLKGALEPGTELVMYAREDTPEWVFLDDEPQVWLQA